MTRVNLAYCPEAKRNLTIQEARVFYFSRPEALRHRLTFYCSDIRCRVPITGVNYDKLPSDIIKSPCFRENAVKKHLPECEWRQHDMSLGSERGADESEHQYRDRMVKQKLGCFLNAFNPGASGPGGDNGESQSETSDADNPERELRISGSGGVGQKNRAGSATTSSLYTLTDTWIEARTKLTAQERAVMQLRVHGVGDVLWKDYFKHIRNLSPGANTGVYFGGLKLPVWRYGAGFTAEFYDQINGCPIRVAVFDKVAKKSSLNHIVQQLLNDKTVDYLSVYLLDPVVQKREDKTGKDTWSITVSSLKTIALYGRQIQSGHSEK